MVPPQNLLLPLIISAVLSGFVSSAHGEDLPFYRAMKNISPQTMDPLLDDILNGIQRYCQTPPINARPSIAELYADMCPLPTLLRTYRSRLMSITHDDQSVVILPYFKDFPLVKKYHFLKSLTWEKARTTDQDPIAFITDIFVTQVAITKGFMAYTSLIEIWNGRENSSDFQMYNYPKIAAYLRSTTLFSATLAYYENILCHLEDHAKPFKGSPCYRYKSKVAGEILASFEKIAPRVNSFIDGINATKSENDDLRLIRLQKIYALGERLTAAEFDSNVHSSNLFEHSEPVKTSSLYISIYDLLKEATVRKATIGNSELVNFYLGVSSILEISSVHKSIWSMRAYKKSNNISKPNVRFSKALENEFEEIYSNVIYFLEAGDENI